MYRFQEELIEGEREIKTRARKCGADRPLKRSMVSSNVRRHLLTMDTHHTDASGRCTRDVCWDHWGIIQAHSGQRSSRGRCNHARRCSHLQRVCSCEQTDPAAYSISETATSHSRPARGGGVEIWSGGHGHCQDWRVFVVLAPFKIINIHILSDASIGVKERREH